MNKAKEEKLCTPCVAHLQRSGEKLHVLKRGSDMKITCDRCGLRKYGGMYVREPK